MKPPRNLRRCPWCGAKKSIRAVACRAHDDLDRRLDRRWRIRRR